jgi:hypothetical protein
MYVCILDFFALVPALLLDEELVILTLVMDTLEVAAVEIS